MVYKTPQKIAKLTPMVRFATEPDFLPDNFENLLSPVTYQYSI